MFTSSPDQRLAAAVKHIKQQFPFAKRCLNMLYSSKACSMAAPAKLQLSYALAAA
jgi:hypothetical protein